MDKFAPIAISRALLDDFTPRQREIARLIAQALPNKLIAAQLGISIKTIQKHRAIIYLKLRAHDPVTFTHMAIALGLAPLMFVAT